MVNVDALLANDEQFMLAESQAVQGMCARAFPPEEEASGLGGLRDGTCCSCPAPRSHPCNALRWHSVQYGQPPVLTTSTSRARSSYRMRTPAAPGTSANTLPCMPAQQVAHAVTIVREEPPGSGDKGRVAEAICRKADELQVGRPRSEAAARRGT